MENIKDKNFVQVELRTYERLLKAFYEYGNFYDRFYEIISLALKGKVKEPEYLVIPLSHLYLLDPSLKEDVDNIIEENKDILKQEQ